LDAWSDRDITINAGKQQLSAEDEELLRREEIVMLLQGNNSMGERVYSYLKLSVLNLRRMKDDILTSKNFLPSDYGQVLAAGHGMPPPELRAQMGVQYGVVQQAETVAPKPALMQKPLWDD
jgi:hypothetical protein